MIFCANPSAQFRSNQAEIEEAVLRVLRGNRHILGEQVSALEDEFAEYIGTKQAIGVANGTDALELALRALEIGPGDEVITVSHTAVATVAAIEAAGAVPVLVDVEPVFYTIDPEKLEQALTRRTRAVIAVHLYGQAAEMEGIEAFCAKHGLELIEDGSQAHGSKWNGKRVGSIGRVGCFSCYPTKNLGAVGDAGLVTTSDEKLAKKIRMLREYGWEKRYVSDYRGRNSRLDELQAAILRIKLRHLDKDNYKRQKLAVEYNKLLNGLDMILPKIREKTEHVFHLYVVRTPNRHGIKEHLESLNIYPGIHYPVPIHLQPAYKKRIKTGSMEITQKLANEVLSLPMYPELENEELKQVAMAINEYIC